MKWIYSGVPGASRRSESPPQHHQLFRGRSNRAEPSCSMSLPQKDRAAPVLCWTMLNKPGRLTPAAARANWCHCCAARASGDAGVGQLISLWEVPIYSGFVHWKWWFSIAVSIYQRVCVFSSCVYFCSPCLTVDIQVASLSHQSWSRDLFEEILRTAVFQHFFEETINKQHQNIFWLVIDLLLWKKYESQLVLFVFLIYGK